jgi:hypothetical protein
VRWSLLIKSRVANGRHKENNHSRSIDACLDFLRAGVQIALAEAQLSRLDRTFHVKVVSC